MRHLIRVIRVLKNPPPPASYPPPYPPTIHLLVSLVHHPLYHHLNNNQHNNLHLKDHLHHIRNVSLLTTVTSSVKSINLWKCWHFRRLRSWSPIEAIFRRIVRWYQAQLHICHKVGLLKCLKMWKWGQNRKSPDKALVTFRFAWAAASTCIHPQCNLMISVLWLEFDFDPRYAGKDCYNLIIELVIFREIIFHFFPIFFWVSFSREK